MVDPMTLYNEIASNILAKVPGGEAMYSQFLHGRKANAASASRAVTDNSAGINNATAANTAPSGVDAVPFSAIVEYFTNGGEAGSDLMRQAIESEIESAALRHNMDANLIRAVIRAESNYRYDAVSHAGAMGLMQLMPNTAASLGITDPFDIRQNIDGGTSYLRRMMDMFNDDVDLAIAAYNAGHNAVRNHGGIPPFEETQRHVPRVRQFYEEYTLQQYQRASEDSRFTS